MKLMIAGSRSIDSFNLSEYIPADVDLIITGGALGIDGLAERYADEHKISKLVVQPEYKKFGRYAPLKRNEIMVDMSDRVLVVWDGVSRGSEHTIRYAKKQNKDLTVVHVDAEIV